MADPFDCIMPGAGPAGSIAAALVAAAGIRTLLVERRCARTQAAPCWPASCLQFASPPLDDQDARLNAQQLQPERPEPIR